MKQLVKSFYHFIPFKKEIFTWIKKFYQPSAKVYKHLTFKGIFKVDVEVGNSFLLHHYGYMIENEIFWCGLKDGWEKQSIGLWSQLCLRSEYILDLGANTGIFSLIAKATNPNSKVYAFEPVQRVFDKLKQNVSINSYDVICIDKAVSNFDGKAKIYDTNAEHILSVTVNYNYLDPSVKVEEVEIETITLNKFIKDNNIPRIDLMKIDVETHEPETLEGFSDYLSIFRPAMLIEILNNEIGARVEKLVNGLGYLYFNIDENNGIQQTEHIVKSDYYNYLLCDERTARALNLFI